MKQFLKRTLVQGLLWTTLAAMPAPAARAPYMPKTCNNGYTHEQEIALGQKAIPQVTKQMKVLPDSSPASQYIQQLGAKLTAFAPGYKWPYNFHVIESKEINAFAMPGGPIFINTGTIEAAQTEAQLAGVMAHEISHVVLRHSTCNMTKQSKTNVGWGLAGILAGVLVPGYGGALAQTGVGMAQNLSYLQMSRTDEKQADMLGVQILYNAGFNPNGMPQMFQIIQDKYGNAGAQFMSDHPNPGNRVEYISQEIASFPPKTNYVNDSPRFEQIRAMLLKNDKTALTSTSLSTGSLSGNVQGMAGIRNIKASDTLTVFQHEGYSLQYPSNWKLYGDSGSIVTIAPEGGIQKGTDGQGAIAYGVVVDSFQPDPGATVDQATRQLIAQLRQANPDLKELGSTESVLVNNRSARSVELQNVSPLSTASNKVMERDWLVTVQRSDGTLNYLIFIAPEKDYRTLHPAFVKMLSNFHVKAAAS